MPVLDLAFASQTQQGAVHGTWLRGSALRGIKLQQVRYVLAAADARSFRQAAEALNIEQSTISRRIRDLEHQLGATIFERSPSGVRLTSTGAEFVQAAQVAAHHLHAAASRAGECGRAERAILRVGVLAPIGSGALSDLLRAVAADGRTGRLVLEEAPGKALTAALEARRLDVAFLNTGPLRPRLRGQAVWSERLMVVLPAAHRLARAGSVGWGELAREDLLFAEAGGRRDLLDHARQRLSRHGDSPRILVQAVGQATLVGLVAIGQGLTVCPASACAHLPDGVTCRPVRRERVETQIVWSPQNDKPVVARLLALCGVSSLGER
jgi:DNA-binding transcriptional LysR family regulator